jgi:hypothetical protein
LEIETMSRQDAEELWYLWSEYNHAKARIDRVTWTNGRPLDEGTLRVAMSYERRAGDAMQRIKKIYSGT